MTDRVLDRLADDLGVQPSALAFLEDVDAATLQRLHAAVVDTRERADRDLAAAFDGTIRLVPRPLRGRIRRLLTGS